MIVRKLVLLLLAANLGVWAWSQGHLSALGLGPQWQSEPERLESQIKPEAVQLASPVQPSAAPSPTPADSAPAPAAEASAPVASTPAPARPALACLQAGPFDEAQAATLRAAATALPAGSWQVLGAPLPGRWMVYIGKLKDLEAVRARRAQLTEQGVATDRPGAAFDPGLSLGRFASEEAARRALADFARRGINDASVATERRDATVYLLRLPQADEALRARAQALSGKPLQPCD